MKFLEEVHRQKNIRYKTLVIGWLLGIGISLISCRDESAYTYTVFSRDSVTPIDAAEETCVGRNE
ncbi:hypothetical protein [Mesonia sp. K7]|uniref:hypothetical protein n=1 Tax=Mesonia sp. K7 TaxID=2218606 RepID=UPI000DA9E259|nr:hypothetical protein [Mesonia sp. K7]PZD77135.1 hypothetical protein DNG35_09835 [Mesonia sp. K7]